MRQTEIEQHIIKQLAAISGKSGHDFDAQTHLIGSNSLVSSRELVELLLALEEYAEDELGAVFDWSSDSAMSEKNSSLRSVGVLAAHLAKIAATK